MKTPISTLRGERGGNFALNGARLWLDDFGLLGGQERSGRGHPGGPSSVPSPAAASGQTRVSLCCSLDGAWNTIVAGPMGPFAAGAIGHWRR